MAEAIDVACPTCLVAPGSGCIVMLGPDMGTSSPGAHSARVALSLYGPEVLAVFTGALDADPDERITPLGDLPLPVGAPAVPMDKWPDGTVLQWERTWTDGPTYTFVAYKVGEDKWYVTGSTGSYSWYDMRADYIDYADPGTLRFVTEWERCGRST